jgi:hypothetical protein
MSKRVQVFLVGAVCFLMGCLVAQQLPFVRAQASSDVKPPKWLYGLTAKARKADEADFTKDTHKYGIEVFKDDNNGNLIYISDTGAIAVVKEK